MGFSLERWQPKTAFVLGRVTVQGPEILCALYSSASFFSPCTETLVAELVTAKRALSGFFLTKGEGGGSGTEGAGRRFSNRLSLCNPPKQGKVPFHAQSKDLRTHAPWCFSCLCPGFDPVTQHPRTFGELLTSFSQLLMQF